jgi:hypothetical protein
MFLQLLYWFLPAYIANSSPPILKKLFPRWDIPVDLGRKWKGVHLLGSHKSWRGVVGGTLLGGGLFLLQKYVLVGMVSTPAIPYASLPWWYGFLLAFGAIFVGDCGESFLKRRRNLKPGRPWAPWDQVDYTLGALLISWWVFWPGLVEALFLIVFNALLAAGSHWLGWKLGLLRERF